MKIVVRQKKENFMGCDEAFVPVAIFDNKNIEEVTTMLNADLTIKMISDNKAEVFRNEKLIGTISKEN